MKYVMQQARAYRNYSESAVSEVLFHHPMGETVHNAMLESSLSFLRKINEFFGCRREACIKVFLKDYPKEWLWGKDDFDLLNDRVMHLSLCEAREGKYNWLNFYKTHLVEAETRFDAFLNELKKTHPEYFE
jgi:hypothetical protein